MRRLFSFYLFVSFAAMFFFSCSSYSVLFVISPQTRLVMEEIDSTFLSKLDRSGVRVVVWSQGEPVALPSGDFSSVVLGPVVLTSRDLLPAVRRAFPELPVRGFVFSSAFASSLSSEGVDVAVVSGASAFTKLASWLNDEGFNRVILLSYADDGGLFSSFSTVNGVSRLVLGDGASFDSVRAALPLPSSDNRIAVVCFFPDFLDELLDFYAGRDGVVIVAVGVTDFSFLVRASLVPDVDSVVSYVAGRSEFPVWRFVYQMN
ncbi:hypothetical protein WKV44_10315 [Spirochaetia bacterium 38H-sp]|uniref:Uncharacterized protein n=1 Tax=Rarispira pelagica TaxID=3141764 RepID=A0ABU9UE30_9SPIR